jgi:hypothetical protein
MHVGGNLARGNYGIEARLEQGWMAAEGEVMSNAWRGWYGTHVRTYPSAAFASAAKSKAATTAVEISMSDEKGGIDGERRD